MLSSCSSFFIPAWRWDALCALKPLLFACFASGSFFRAAVAGLVCGAAFAAHMYALLSIEDADLKINGGLFMISLASHVGITLLSQLDEFWLRKPADESEGRFFAWQRAQADAAADKNEMKKP